MAAGAHLGAVGKALRTKPLRKPGPKTQPIPATTRYLRRETLTLAKRRSADSAS